MTERIGKRLRCAASAQRYRDGFTLFELLVVLSIVSLLLGFLLPAVGRAREQARVAACLGNQRSLAQGWHLYAQEYGQVAGMHEQIAAFAAAPWGQKPGNFFMGGYQAWMTVAGSNYWDGPSGLWHGGGHESYYSGIGYVEPYVQQPRAFYCPGTSASFERSNQLWIDPYQCGAGVLGRDGAPWFQTWLDGFGTQPDNAGSIDGRPSWGLIPDGATGPQSVPGNPALGGTVITYFYRAGNYYTQDPPVGMASWNRAVLRPASPIIQGKAMLTCYWVNIPASGQYPARWELDWSSAPHGGLRTNVAHTDGHARTWKLPERVTPVWTYYDDNAWFGAAFDQGHFGFQMPYWWYLADRAK